MPNVAAYRTSLQRSAATYASALQPRPAPLPETRHEINLRSDCPPQQQGITLAGLMQHLTCRWHCDLFVRHGKRFPIALPQRAALRVDVSAHTKARVDMNLQRGGAPWATLRLSHPLYIRNPLPTWYGLGSAINSFLGFYLETIYMHQDNSIWIEGHVGALGHVLHKRCKMRVSKPSAASRAEQHSLVGIWMASAVRFLHHVPAQASKALSTIIHSDMPEDAQEAHLKFVDSLHHMLSGGVFRADGTLHADKPVVVRTDLADIRFDKQKCCYHVRGHAHAVRGGTAITLSQGSQIDCNLVRASLCGALFFDGRSIQGRGIELTVQKLRLSALLNNGTASAMLLPLDIDTEAQPGQRPVAAIVGDFVFQEVFEDEPSMTAAGRVRFALPVHVEDTDRLLRNVQGTLRLAGFKLAAVLHGEVQSHAPLPTKTRWAMQQAHYLHHGGGRVHTRVRLGVDVDAFEAVAHLLTSEAAAQSWGGRADAPLHIFGSHTGKRPLKIKMDYEDVGASAAAATFGATFAFYMPVRIMSPATLSVAIAQGKTQLGAAQLGSRGEIRLGAHVRDGSGDVAGHAHFSLDAVDGTLTAYPQKLGELQLEREATFTVRGRRGESQGHTFVQRPPQAHVDLSVLRRPGSAVHVRGRGAFSLPAQLPPGAKLELTMPGGALSLTYAYTQLSCCDLTFCALGAAPHVHATICADAAAGLGLGYQTELRMAAGVTQLVPLAAATAPQQAPDDASEGYYSAEEDALL